MKWKTAFWFSLWIVCVMLAVAATGDSPEVQVAVAARQDETGNVTLLVQIVKATETVLREGSTQSTEIPSTRIHLDTVDEIRIKTQKEDDRDTSVFFLPSGWKAVQDGKEVKLTGPPLHAQDGCFYSLNLGKTKISKDVSLQIFSQGKKVVDQRFLVTLLPRLQIINTLKDLHTMPRSVVPGEEFHFTAENHRQTPAEGKWTVGETPAEKISTELRYRVKVPEDASPDTTLDVKYTDPWEKTIVNITGSEGIRISPLPQEEKPRITDCTPKTFGGSILCVCGWFPNGSWDRLLIDGKPVGTPLGASTATVHVLLTADLQVGTHVVTGDPVAGFSPSDRAETQLLQVGGELDRNKLWRGESTPMRLWVRGTEEVMQLRVQNMNPSIITIDGGIDQIIPTSGGGQNQLEKTVHGISPGNFEIKYELNADPCPCGGGGEAAGSS